MRATPAGIRGGLRLVRHSPVLRGLMAVEACWAVSMIVFETFQPVRLAELLGSEAEAGAWMGVVAAVGWGTFALGAALAGLLAKRWGVARTAILARILNSLGAVVMGLVLGPADRPGVVVQARADRGRGPPAAPADSRSAAGSPGSPRPSASTQPAARLPGQTA